MLLVNTCFQLPNWYNVIFGIFVPSISNIKWRHVSLAIWSTHPCYYSSNPTLLNMHQGRVVQKAISGNPGLKFNQRSVLRRQSRDRNRLFILVCSTWQLQLKFSKAKHFIVCAISEQQFSNILVYIFIIFSIKISTNPGLS